MRGISIVANCSTGTSAYSSSGGFWGCDSARLVLVETGGAVVAVELEALASRDGVTVPRRAGDSALASPSGALSATTATAATSTTTAQATTAIVRRRRR